nr:glycosyltransferase family 1 protein [Klebsiella aerogenes]
MILIPDGQIQYDLSFLEQTACQVEVVKGGSGHFWEQVTLPLYLMRNKSNLLINLCNTAPAFYSNQIVTHHDITYAKFPNGFSLPFRLIYNTLPRFFLKRSRFIITVSEFSKKEIKQHYKIDEDKIDVIYNAVNESFISLDEKCSVDRTSPYFLAVSSQAYHKNFHGLIESFSNLPLDLGIELKIIGGSSTSLKAGGINNVSNNIKFLGRVSDEELIELYQNASGFIFPSLYEGFGIPPLEAQACGCPVIASNMAVMPEVLQNSVLYFDPLIKNDLCEKIITFMQDPVLRNNLHLEGVKNVKRFSWECSANKLNSIINKFS